MRNTIFLSHSRPLIYSATLTHQYEMYYISLNTFFLYSCTQFGFFLGAVQVFIWKNGATFPNGPGPTPPPAFIIYILFLEVNRYILVSIIFLIFKFKSQLLFEFFCNCQISKHQWFIYIDLCFYGHKTNC